MYTKVLRGHIRHSTISLVHHLICLQVKSSQATFSRTIVTPQPSLQKDVCTCCKITISLPWCMQKPQMSSGPAVINSFNGAYSTPFTQSVCKPLVHIYMDGLVASTDLTASHCHCCGSIKAKFQMLHMTTSTRSEHPALHATIAYIERKPPM